MSRFVGTVLVALALAACRGTTDPDDGILSYDGSVSVESEAPIVIAGEVTVRNTSSSIVTIERNICGFELNLHWYASSSSSPAWKSNPGACPAISLPLALSPGTSYTFELQAAIPSSLRDGLYYLNVVSEHWKGGEPIKLGNIEIANGKVKR